MEVINTEFGFSITLPDGYEEITKSKYKEYNIDPSSTLHVFYKLGYDIPRTISINRDDTFKSTEEYEKLININIKSLEMIGMNIISKTTCYTDTGMRIDKVVSHFQALTFTTLFTAIKDMLIASSIEIVEIDDEMDQDLFKIFSSIKLI